MIKRKRIKLCIVASVFYVICMFYGSGHSTTLDRSHSEGSFFHKRHLLSTNDTNETTNAIVQCKRPDIEQFPRGFFTQQQRLRGAIAIHFLVSIYMIIGSAIVCDHYFVPSIDSICQKIKIKNDVAGAMFMAIGSSAPEFATTMIAIFIAKNVDIGIGTVLGSAVFNVTFVIAIIAFFSGSTLLLHWYPIVRDSTFYVVSIIVTIVVLIDEKIYWYEAMILLILYAFYVLIMALNSRIEERLGRNPKFLKSRLDVVEANKISVFEKETQNEHESILQNPSTLPRGMANRLLFVIVFPIYLPIYYTIPNLKNPSWKNFFPLTFIISIVWIVALSYVNIWMITIIGYTFHISDTIMSLTFIALGASIPDAYSSLIVARYGHGNMAIANALGSNIFDLLVCLGLPWFIGSLVMRTNGMLVIQSKGLAYSTLSLLGTILVLVLAIHLNKWRLDIKLGVFLMLVYVLFLTSSILFELNIIGSNNLRMCMDSLW